MKRVKKIDCTKVFTSYNIRIDIYLKAQNNRGMKFFSQRLCPCGLNITSEVASKKCNNHIQIERVVAKIVPHSHSNWTDVS